ncbi:MAG: hypothetical protein ACRDSN_09530 [Pseudonocardiaceae bacterium]
MSTRDELHRLVDELDEQQLPDATALLRTLKPGDVPRPPRRRLSLTGAYDSGRTDVATRSAEILRDELGRRDPHSS